MRCRLHHRLEVQAFDPLFPRRDSSLSCTDPATVHVRLGCHHYRRWHFGHLRGQNIDCRWPESHPPRGSRPHWRSHVHRQDRRIEMGAGWIQNYNPSWNPILCLGTGYGLAQQSFNWNSGLSFGYDGSAYSSSASMTADTCATTCLNSAASTTRTMT